MAYAAQYGKVVLVAWVLMIANMFWAIAYDTEYAMVDRDDDARIGLKSSAILLGRYDVLGVMTSHAIFLILVVIIGAWQFMGILYYVGIIIAAALVRYQHLLIRQRQRDRCFKAFLSNNLLGAVIFAGILVDGLLGSRRFGRGCSDYALNRHEIPRSQGLHRATRAPR